MAARFASLVKCTMVINVFAVFFLWIYIRLTMTAEYKIAHDERTHTLTMQYFCNVSFRLNVVADCIIMQS